MIGPIGTTLSGIERTLLNRLAEAQAGATLSMLRLATNAKINAPSDDPAGFIRLSSLDTQLNNVKATLPNVTAASNIVAQTQLTLDQIRTQVETIRTKAVADQDQTLTADRRSANQAAIDAAVTAINRLASTSINGRKVLDGSADFTYSGVNTSQVSDIRATSLGWNASKAISGTVTVAATRATKTHNEVTGLITNDATFTLTGDRGSAAITVTTGEDLDTIATRVNQESHLTGVTASVSGGVDLVLSSIAYGSDAGVSINVTSGTFAATGTGAGTNGTATINGHVLTGNGKTFAIQDNGFSATVDFAGGFSGAFSTINVSGDGLTFALSPDLNRRSTLALPGLQASRLGGPSGRLSDLLTGGSLGGLGTKAPQAVRIVDEALSQLTLIEGQVDGFASATIDSSAALLDGLQSKLQDSIDSLNKVNTDEETIVLAKNRALASNALTALSILGDQRAQMVVLIQKIAGLI